MALLLKGHLHEQLGESGRAAEVYRAVLFHAGSQPTLPSPIAQQVERARAFLEAHRQAVEGKLAAFLDGFAKRLTELVLPKVNTNDAVSM